MNWFKRPSQSVGPSRLVQPSYPPSAYGPSSGAVPRSSLDKLCYFSVTNHPTLPSLYHLGFRDCSTLLPASTTIPLRNSPLSGKISALRQANSTQGSALESPSRPYSSNSVRRAYVRLTHHRRSKSIHWLPFVHSHGSIPANWYGSVGYL